MPARFAEVKSEIHRLGEEAETLRSISSLLWHTGESLTIGVRDVFRTLGYEAELTPQGATYDVTVAVNSGARLLIEVTGIGGALKKDSNKIAQVLQAIQKEVSENDRVIVALNAFRGQPLVQRNESVVTPDALSLLTGLKVNLVETKTLFNIWKQFLSEAASGSRRIEELYGFQGGLFV